MTTQNIVENILSAIPTVKETQIIFDLDDAQKLFATETGILEERGSLSAIATSVGWTLPSGFRELTDVTIYDSDGYPKYLGDYNYAYEIEFGKFYIYSLTSTPLEGLSSGINSAYIHYKKIPTTLASRSTALEIEDEFTKALEHYLLADYFGKYPTLEGGVRDLSSASWHQKRYEELKIKAKRYANSKDKLESTAQNYQHAGAYALPRRTNDTTLGTATVQTLALAQVYTKYIRFTLVGSGGDGAKTPSTAMIGYTDVVGTVSSDTFTTTSTADFEKDTMILCNNSAVSWVYGSSSLITFTLPSGWDTVEIEIYER